VSWDQRVCQSCGAANALNRETCYACGTSLVSGAVSSASNALAQPQQSSAAAVVDGEYRVVPFIGRLTAGSAGAGSAAAVSQQLQALINQHAQQGWEFHSVGKVGAVVSPGCLGSLFGAATSYITFDQVIFRRAERAEPWIPSPVSTPMMA
jgi:hypothetical protein